MDRYEDYRKLEVTTIEKFDPTNFIFFTHSVNPQSELNGHYEMIKNSTQYSKNQIFDLFANPFQIKNKKRISTSLVNQYNCNTYGRIGFILSFPIENILCIGQPSFNKSNDD